MSENIKELTSLLKDRSVRITELNAQAKELGKEKSDFENRLIALMENIGTTTVKNDLGNFRISTSVLPVAKDWEAIHAYIKTNDAFHLMQKRLSSTAYREMVSAGEDIPGTESFEKQTISITKPSGS
jgi:hypothetical protein